MNTEILGIIAMFGATLLLGYPLGKYIAKVYGGERTLLDPVFNPLEKWLFRLSGINPNEEWSWQKNLIALLAINLVWFLIGMLLLMNMGWLPLNPDHNPSQSAGLAFNTTISFLVNCNLQHYAGETGISYLGQLYLMFLQFTTAATGMAAAAIIFRAFRKGQHKTYGNFFNDYLKTCTRILLPICLVLGVILMFNGSPMTMEGRQQMVSMQGDTMQVATGPVAAFVPIKHLGTNGGGFFGANGSHPLENPNYFTNMLEMWAQMVIPFAMIFAFGFYIKRRKLAWIIFSVMTVGFLALAIPNIAMETAGNPQIAQMGIDNSLGNLEGKEMRIGAAASGYWSIATTVISTGSVNSWHDSYMPLSGMNMMLAMMINCFYGGVGVGIVNYLIFIILAVFISGLMVGRTPEFLGKKIEAREMKIAMIVALIHPFLILVGTGLAAASPSLTYDTLANPGFHGFSEMLYEYTSSAANNGSGFEGLGDDTPWWNISTGFVLILGRYLSIIGMVAVAGLLGSKKYIPESAGTLKTDTPTFGLMTMAVIVIVAALAFFPALTLGPIAEYFKFLIH
ncbi:potassium-transporting ATPase subunit KdpA [Patescibacteria group bacterium]|nr:potassium-transporting ATPase subunit KdpA [Patescibacteria group bacterium]